jgi:hypothetical protein
MGIGQRLLGQGFWRGWPAVFPLSVSWEQFLRRFCRPGASPEPLRVSWHGGHDWRWAAGRHTRTAPTIPHCPTFSLKSGAESPDKCCLEKSCKAGRVNEPDQGKPLERAGRKATGLRLKVWDMVAGPPGSTAPLPYHRWALYILLLGGAVMLRLAALEFISTEPHASHRVRNQATDPSCVATVSESYRVARGCTYRPLWPCNAALHRCC